jgi:hypothetical protein
LRLSGRGDYLPRRKDSRKSPTDSPSGVLPMEGVTDAVVLLNVLGVILQRGCLDHRPLLPSAAKKPPEKA